MPFVNDLGESHQFLEALASEHAQLQSDLQGCRCPQCNRFGIVSDTHDYYGAIYKCNCLPISWVISPETGEKIEEVQA